MSEWCDKIPADLKTPIEAALTELKAAHQAQNLEAVEAGTKKLNDAWAAASQAIYNAQQQGGAQQGAQADAGNAGGGDGGNGGDNNDNVTDAEYEEVK